MSQQLGTFDFPSAIKELAEARIRCPQGSMANEGEPDQQWLCPHTEHGYTGYYMPFALLPESDVRVACWEISVAPEMADHGALESEQGKGWTWVPYDYHSGQPLVRYDDPEEALIRAALARVKEEHDILPK